MEAMVRPGPQAGVPIVWEIDETQAVASDRPFSDRLQEWLESGTPHTLGDLTEIFEEKSFAILFVLLLGLSALPIPTGGATHVFDVIAVIVAAQLVAGRDHFWIPRRWRGTSVGGGRQDRFIRALLRLLRFLERFSRPRLSFLFDHRLTNSIFGLAVIVFTCGAFFAPPFSGLDTLPALGVVLLSIGVLLEDFAIVVVAVVVGVSGIVLEIVLGKAALAGLKTLF
jgi:hypothetical protein